MRRTAGLLILVFTLGLSACSIAPEINLGPREERDTTWAKMGTPAKIVDERQIEILIPDGVDEKKQPKWKRSKGRLEGMCTIDEPTLEYYRELDRKVKAGELVAALKP